MQARVALACGLFARSRFSTDERLSRRRDPGRRCVSSLAQVRLAPSMMTAFVQEQQRGRLLVVAD